MAPRQQLHDLLKEITANIYFQPPTGTKMEYPCIKYERSGSKSAHADNQVYTHAKKYMVTVIDRDPDSTLPDEVEEQSFCEFDRFFPADNLNHWVFTLTF